MEPSVVNANPFGYRPDLAAAHVAGVLAAIRASGRRATFANAAPGLVGSGAGMTVILHAAAKKLFGKFLPSQNQPRGTCTSRGVKRAGDLIQCVQIANGSGEQFAPLSHAVIYGGGREHAGMLGGNPNDPNDDGCTGAAVGWAAVNLGDLRNADVKDDDNDDKLACLWGAKGLPADVKDAAKAHVFKGMAQCRASDDVRDAVCNLKPVTIASTVGFEGNGGFRRDANGKCWTGGQWPHQMVVTGYRNDKDEFLIDQSWGPDQPPGPLGDLDIPSYSFWASRGAMDRIVAEGDTWAFTGLDGWPAEKLHWLI